MNLIQTLESMQWGPYQEITTPSGPMKVKTMKATPSYWELWKNPTLQQEMQRNGYTLRKIDVQGQPTWTAFRWVKFVSDAKKSVLIEESMAEDCDYSLMVPPGINYRPFQKAGIKYCMERLFGQNGFAPQKAVLLGDDMGLGKTVQAIGVMNQDPDLRSIRALIVCPASLKLNWRNELQRWLMDGMGSEAFVVRKEWPGELQQARFVIVNYDILHRYEKEIRREEWDYLIVDEAHFLKNQKSRRAIYLLGGVHEIEEGSAKIVNEVPARREIFMTGTPIPNRVKEGWTLFQRCDPEGIGKNYKHFIQRYCLNNENLKELQTRLRVKCMVRRAKSQVLKELPPKQRQVITLDPDDLGCTRLFKQEMSIFKEYQALIQTWQVQIELAKAKGVETYRQTLALKKQKLGLKASELAKLRMSTAMAKVPAVLERMKELKREGKKVILFAHHKCVLDALQEGLTAAGMSLVRVDGSTSINKRQKAVEDFQAGMVDVFLGGIIPAGVGLTLTQADTVVFAELDWVPGNMTQAEDRAHRMGQLLIVWILHMVMEGSLDEYIAKKLIQKQETIEAALDAKSLDAEEFDDEDEAADAMLAKETAASKGVTAVKLAEEAEKLTDRMIHAISVALSTILKVNNSVDQEILDALREGSGNGTATRLELALARRILFRRRGELEESIAKDMEWPKKEEACTKA